jgi:hypothetical protein
MFYPVAMLAFVAINTVPSAPAFGRSIEASALVHHVAGRPRAGIGNARESEEQKEAETVLGDPERRIGALLTEKHLNELFPGNSPYGINVHDDAGPFQEYFAPDGAIRGHDEKASWSIEGDTICIEFEEKRCFGVRRLADSAYTLESDGRVDGYFKVAEGNLFEY